MIRITMLIAFAACGLWASAQDGVPVPVPIPQAASKYLDAIESHMDYLTEHSRDELGDEKTAMWLATIDIRTNSLPDSPLAQPARWYRKVSSPGGSNLYWDQPSIVAAYELSVRTGCACYEDAADAYLRDFLDRCVGRESGLFDWGNHRYYDVTADQVVAFSGGYHECRPHTPAWETLWAIDSQATERSIRAMAAAHIRDPATGLFDRHGDPQLKPAAAAESDADDTMPLLEAGAVVIDSLGWLANKKQPRDNEIAQLALRVARYSFAHRDPHTQLVPNQPLVRRGDDHTSSTEVGLWAGSLVRAAEYTGMAEFQQMADVSLRAWLTRGFDEKQGKYFGQLSLQTGKPLAPESPREHAPPLHAELFDLQQRPNHNYPMPMAETCLRLYEKTGDEVYRQAAGRWVTHIRNSLPANGDHGGYAEDYGRVIHFLVRAADVLERREYRDLAVQVADEAMDRLYVPKMGMFRSHPGEDRCDAVDGPGILILALLYLDGGDLAPSAFAF